MTTTAIYWLFVTNLTREFGEQKERDYMMSVVEMVHALFSFNCFHSAVLSDGSTCNCRYFFNQLPFGCVESSARPIVHFELAKPCVHLSVICKRCDHYNAMCTFIHVTLHSAAAVSLFSYTIFIPFVFVTLVAAFFRCCLYTCDK